MNKYWKSQFEHWTIVQAKSPEEQPRGHLLSLFILIITINIVLNLLNASTLGIATFWVSGVQSALSGYTLVE
jgi:hypothetical protein